MDECDWQRNWMRMTTNLQNVETLTFDNECESVVDRSRFRIGNLRIVNEIVNMMIRLPHVDNIIL